MPKLHEPILRPFDIQRDAEMLAQIISEQLLSREAQGHHLVEEGSCFIGGRAQVGNPQLGQLAPAT